jgi:hydroxyethylthiazole kinase-like uncharacterized protein yjeF
MPGMALPVIDVLQMRAWEAASWAAGVSETDVIRRAGEAVARLVERMTQEGDSILILAGKGHNGEDARLAGEALRRRRVQCLPIGGPALAQPALDEAIRARPALIVDGLFGIGLNRALGPEWVALIESVNRSGRPILAVDVPSGLDAASGQVRGTAIRATATLTLGTIKKGLLAASAWPFVGRLEAAPDIGLIPCPHASDAQWLTASDFSDFPPPREVAGHKGSFGHVLIIAGSLGYHGAAVLAARGALRSQPGLVTVWTTQDTYLPVAAQLQAAMVHPWRPDLELPPSITAIVGGPGLAAADCPGALRERVAVLWAQSPLPMLADASALAWLPQTPGKALLSTRVLTPHPGEAARLLGVTASQVQAGRSQALRELSARYGQSWVVLKGHQTLVGSSQGPYYVNSTGNPHLAQGGSGDLLSGFLGGVLAQPRLQEAGIAKTIGYAVWRHGRAADDLQAGVQSWTIDDLARTI